MINEYIVGIPTYTRYDLLNTTIESFLKCDPYHIYIINNGNKDYIVNNEKITVIKTKHNLGVARSWDILVNLSFPRTCIISNDDVEFSPQVITSLIEDPHEITLSSQGFSLFKITQKAYLIVGEFDKNFYPAYYEDNDYYNRCLLKDIKIGRSSIELIHRGSSTIASYDKEEKDAFNYFFRLNTNYYVNKWGGLPGKESHTEK